MNRGSMSQHLLVPRFLFKIDQTSSTIIDPSEQGSMDFTPTMCNLGAGEGLFEPHHTQEQMRLMLCHDEPLPFERDKNWWRKVEPPAAAGLLRNLLQRKPLLRLTADDVLRVSHCCQPASNRSEGQGN